MSILRRDLVKLGAGLTLLGTASRMAHAQSTATPTAASPPAGTAAPESTPFDNGTVRLLAQRLSKKPYSPPSPTLPNAIANMDFDQFRSIAFNPEKALWHGQNLAFDVEFFPRGFLYKPRIGMNEV
ncbi:glucan biosynthesis protein, partial [Gluconobacter oxydans]